MGAMGSYSPSHGSIGIPSPRCTSYSHGSIGIQQSRCTSYHHGSLGIHKSRYTSYHYGSIGIHSYRCTSYVSGSPFGYYAKRWFEVGPLPSGPGVSSACGGIVFERTNRAVFVAHIAPERANEVVYNRWIGVPECARGISLLHRKIHELQQSFHVQQTGAPP